MKRNLAEIESSKALARMIGDDRGRNHRKLARSPAVEDVDETMIGFGYEQHHPPPGGTIAHLPIHMKALGDRGKASLQRGQLHREIGGGEDHPHEEFFCFDVVELLGVEDVLSIVGEKRRNRRNDAGTIRTGQRQDILRIGH
jgi:hypothetical protein